MGRPLVFRSRSMVALAAMMVAVGVLAAGRGSWSLFPYPLALAAVLLAGAAWAKRTGRDGVELPTGLLSAAFIVAGVTIVGLDVWTLNLRASGLVFPSALIVIGLLLLMRGRRLRAS